MTPIPWGAGQTPPAFKNSFLRHRRASEIGGYFRAQPWSDVSSADRAHPVLPTNTVRDLRGNLVWVLVSSSSGTRCGVGVVRSANPKKLALLRSSMTTCIGLIRCATHATGFV